MTRRDRHARTGGQPPAPAPARPVGAGRDLGIVTSTGSLLNDRRSSHAMERACRAARASSPIAPVAAHASTTSSGRLGAASSRASRPPAPAPRRARRALADLAAAGLPDPHGAPDLCSVQLAHYDGTPPVSACTRPAWTPAEVQSLTASARPLRTSFSGGREILPSVGPAWSGSPSSSSDGDDDRGDDGLVQNHDDASPFVIW